MLIKLKNGQIKKASVFYYGPPDLLLLEDGRKIFSTHVEILDTPEPDDKNTGFKDCNDEFIYSGDYIKTPANSQEIHRIILYQVKWNSRYGEYYSERIAGNYGGVNIRHAHRFARVTEQQAQKIIHDCEYHFRNPYRKLQLELVELMKTNPSWHELQCVRAKYGIG
jgi:hypothetical protein